MWGDAATPWPRLADCALALLGLLLVSGPARGADTADMNILVIGVEDWTTAAIGCYGNDVVKTPAVDALAARGLRFDRAYCQATVCQPSRASMATGLRPDSTRVYHNSEALGEYLPAGSPFMAGVLKQKGTSGRPRSAS